MHVIAAKAVCLQEAMTPEFKGYQQDVVANAAALANELIGNGLRLVSGGTDNHLMLVDVRTKGMTGKKAEELLEKVNITVNKNAIPFDPEKPTVTSGVRLGTPAVTSRGLKAQDMKVVGQAIALALNYPDDADKQAEARLLVEGLCRSHPLYGI
jgi:glycine hydroxymethyltransferase